MSSSVSAMAGQALPWLRLALGPVFQHGTLLVNRGRRARRLLNAICSIRFNYLRNRSGVNLLLQTYGKYGVEIYRPVFRKLFCGIYLRLGDFFPNLFPAGSCWRRPPVQSISWSVAADVLKNIHGVAKVAELDGDELNYLVAKDAETKRQP